MLKDFPPLHPAIVHFPIALLLLAGLFGAISLFVKREFWKDLAFKSLLIGVIFTPFAVLTGLIDEQKMAHDSVDQTLLIHKYNGLVLMFFYQILIVWFWLRKKLPGNKEYTAWVFCLLLGSGMVLLQGYLGGEMVFTKGMGVKPVEESGMGHGGGEMNMNDSSKTDHGHDGKDDHKEGSMKDMDKKDMKGMDKKEMKEMKDMDNMESMKGKNMKSMKGMDNKKGMGNMKEMKGMDNMKDMKRMDKKDMKDMPGMDTMKNMKGSDNMKDMKNMPGMDSTMKMGDMKNMNMPMKSAMDTFRFPDNNPASKKSKKPVKQ